VPHETILPLLLLLLLLLEPCPQPRQRQNRRKQLQYSPVLYGTTPYCKPKSQVLTLIPCI
jgi:hypothetical protein